jgi:hypothetical protein
MFAGCDFTTSAVFTSPSSSTNITTVPGGTEDRYLLVLRFDTNFNSVAKHIHGDNNDDLAGDDLDKLIEEFSKNS